MTDPGAIDNWLSVASMRVARMIGTCVRVHDIDRQRMIGEGEI